MAKSMVKGLRHVAIVVSDLERCRDFYSFLGFTTKSEDTEAGEFIDSVVGISGAKVHWIKMASPDGSLLELLKYENAESGSNDSSPQASDRKGHSHLALTIENIDSFVEDFLAKGGRTVNPPKKNPQGTVRVCYAHDPEGNLLELVEELSE